MPDLRKAWERKWTSIHPGTTMAKRPPDFTLPGFNYPVEKVRQWRREKSWWDIDILSPETNMGILENAINKKTKGQRGLFHFSRKTEKSSFLLGMPDISAHSLHPTLPSSISSPNRTEFQDLAKLQSKITLFSRTLAGSFLICMPLHKLLYLSRPMKLPCRCFVYTCYVYTCIGAASGTVDRVPALESERLIFVISNLASDTN